MKLLNKIKSIAIGSFDGLHRGHQTLLSKVDALVIIERNGGYLTPGYKRSEFTDKICCFYHFEKIKSLSPEGFVAKLQEDFPLLDKIVVGYDFHFGKAKAGNAKLLKTLFRGEVCIVDEVSYEGVSVHSRTIKNYLKEGELKMANALLGRAYEIEGEVIKGQGLGSKSLFATLNLCVDHYQLPLEGVYATRTKIEGQMYDSVSFLGHRISTDGHYAVETHILDQEISEVQGSIALVFIGFIRANRKFDDLEGLKAQISDDIRVCRSLLS